MRKRNRPMILDDEVTSGKKRMKLFATGPSHRGPKEGRERNPPPLSP
jgi:hypothetical protein